MYCGRVFVALLTLLVFGAIHVSSQSCNTVQSALLADPACSSAFVDVGDAVASNMSTISQEDLIAYCQPSCRSLVNDVIICNNGGDSNATANLIRVNAFICRTNANNLSCFDHIRSPEFTNLTDSFESSSVCPDEIPDGQMCNQACQTQFQDYVIQGGCCIVELFEIADSLADNTLATIFAQCPVDLSRAGTCAEIGATVPPTSSPTSGPTSSPTSNPTTSPTVSPQTCESIRDDLLANPACFTAFLAVFDDNNTNINQNDLREYCQQSCRNLIANLIGCGEDVNITADAFLRLTTFVCTTNPSGVSCYEYLDSPEFTALEEAFERSGVCPDELPEGQMCSQTCRDGFQNFVIQGGCCVAELFELGSQIATLDDILESCPIDLSRAGMCTEVGAGGGASGLKALGSILLFAVLFVLGSS